MTFLHSAMTYVTFWSISLTDRVSNLAVGVSFSSHANDSLRCRKIMKSRKKLFVLKQILTCMPPVHFSISTKFQVIIYYSICYPFWYMWQLHLQSLEFLFFTAFRLIGPLTVLRLLFFKPCEVCQPVDWQNLLLGNFFNNWQIGYNWIIIFAYN